ncbi:hypothetical protein BDQ12DRAFT_706206 [Crucibulum laeve]|uniref:Uncharacterized protein n=1 Tax=Crucibulum laeve TaxID=68775 RepID=A0A5C3LWB2_9AGAR|nr:hypothetical protein BDQ12DRAFT_706206 [Crucibulum laeve]
MATYGRHRQSIADIENELHNIFNQHPDSHVNDSGEPVIPADALVDIFRSFSNVYNGVELLSDSELDMLKGVLASNPGLEVTPQILLQFIAEKTKSSPPRSPSSEEEQLPGRGRTEERDNTEQQHRSSSSGSDAGYYQGPHSRPPSRGPQTPGYGKSPFDTERRQRSTPLTNAAPSSWAKRPAPAHRRKSDAGSRSDSESWSSSPSSFNRNGPRTRAPSNPTSPTGSENHWSPVASPTFGRPSSRPHSRTRSQPSSAFNNNSFSSSYNHFGSPARDEHGYSSPDDTINASDSFEYRNDDSFMGPISSLQILRPGSDSDSDDEQDSSLGLVLDRVTVSSTASMEPSERLDALQRVNTELGRKLMDAERTLQNKLSEHESELEEMQSRLEEMRSELSSTKREEKELRSKERQNMTQIAALELEVSKVTKALEHARATYNSLQRQYQEQCATSEKYRDDLHQRGELINSLREAASLHEVETAKWAKEHESYEDRISHLEDELSVAQQAHAQLDEQKQENLLLKETIDRMRFDMDEMRSAATIVAAGGGNSGSSSAANTMSKSLGAELLGKMKWGIEDEEEEVDDEEGSETTAVDLDEDDTEGEEDVIQTIITRKKRKVASRANKIETRTFEEVREYSDSSTQYEPELFCISHASQTDAEPKILKSSFGLQTEEPPTRIFAIQTDPEPIPPPRVTIEMEIQTDQVEEEEQLVSRSPSPQHDESLASSSSTIIPPTPKAQPHHLELPTDQPPAYNQINTTRNEEEERDWGFAAETLKKWHHGVKIPFEPVPGGISEEAAEEWKALKEELGVECMVIDKIIEESRKAAGPSRSPKDGKPPRKSSRFYNIYNTYIIGDKGPSTLIPQTLAVAGVSALVMLALAPYMAPQYNIPGGPTYYDRAAWNSFNTMQAAGEGFSPDGTAAVWNFLGRVGGGAARIARGWPT